MKQSDTSQNVFSINVGPLNGLAALTYYLAEQFKLLNRDYASGKNPEVIWDLRNVMPRYQNMATLTAFLSLAHRLRSFTGHAHGALLSWNPRVLSFWSDIAFLDLSMKYDLIAWPEKLIGGYPSKVTNPNTIIVDFPNDTNIPDKSDILEWKAWKDNKREEVKEQLMLKCSRLFEKSSKYRLPSKLRDQIAITSAELIVNSLLHGNSMAFLGIQRTSKRITVAVCDAGIGFVNSLQKQNRQWSQLKELNHVDAIFIGSLENMREMGLRRAIDMTVNVGGHVLVLSNDAEVRWDGELWERAKNSLHPERYVAPNIREIFGEPASSTVNIDTKLNGYYRLWRTGLRGTRISFEIDFDRYKDNPV